MTRVMAQGTFDLLHPGHLHYLRESAALGDELYVVIARDSRKEREPVMPEDARQAVVDALEMVDEAVLGSEDSIFDSVARIEPDTITLGHDQPYNAAELVERLRSEGFPDIGVKRIGAYEGEICSSTQLRDRVRDQ